MAQNLMAQLRRSLEDLKEKSRLSDAQIARAMNELAPDITAYQQKVSDFFSTEMKRPELDFIAALCAALGASLADAIATIERGSTLKRDADWEWLMFGRQLGPTGRVAAREFVNGIKPGAAAAPQPRRATRRKRVGDRE